MGIIGGQIGYRLLRSICPDGEAGYLTGGAYSGRSKIEILLGPQIRDELSGRVVIDFGCGWGEESIDMAQHGAKRIVGLDLREELLIHARSAAQEAGVEDRCVFTTRTDEKADVIVS